MFYTLYYCSFRFLLLIFSAFSSAVITKAAEECCDFQNLETLFLWVDNTKEEKKIGLFPFLGKSICALSAHFNYISVEILVLIFFMVYMLVRELHVMNLNKRKSKLLLPEFLFSLFRYMHMN